MKERKRSARKKARNQEDEIKTLKKIEGKRTKEREKKKKERVK